MAFPRDRPVRQYIRRQRAEEQETWLRRPYVPKYMYRLMGTEHAERQNRARY